MASRNREIALFLREHWPFLLLFLGAATLRFWNLGNADFSHDELSALYRTRYSSFLELIREGVRVDGHPALVQVFLYYWAPAVDYSEFWVKLPSVLLGLGTIVLVYFSYLRHGGSINGAGIVASIVSFSQLFIYHHQVARPYAYAGFFVALCAYGYYSWFYHKRATKYLVIFTIGAALAAYTHYIALLSVIIIGMSALIKDIHQVKPWILVATICLVLFSPHLEIFLYQLSLGGVGQWLGAPDLSWPLDFFAYSSNYVFTDEWWWLLVTMIILLPKSKTAMRKSEGLYWFLAVFGIAFFYSVFRNPVLQYSTLVFIGPYILFGASDKKPSRNIKPSYLAINALLIVLLISNLFKSGDRYFMKEAHMSPPKELSRLDYFKALPIYYHWSPEKWEFYRKIDPSISKAEHINDLPDSLAPVGFTLVSDHSTPGYWPLEIKKRGYHLLDVENHFGFDIKYYSRSSENARDDLLFISKLGAFNFLRGPDNYQLIAEIKDSTEHYFAEQNKLVIDLSAYSGHEGSQVICSIKDPKTDELLAWIAHPITGQQSYYSLPIGKYPFDEYEWRILLDHSKNKGTSKGKLELWLLRGNHKVYGLFGPIIK